MDIVTLEEIARKIRELPDDLQRQVLIFVDNLQASSMRGQPGKSLAAFAGVISPDDLSCMSQAIEEGCEQVDAGEW